MTPHHFINADGTCHAGDLFEHGTETTGCYLTEQVDGLLARLARVEALVGDWQANGNSCGLGDPTADIWHQAARQLLEIVDPE